MTIYRIWQSPNPTYSSKDIEWNEYRSAGWVRADSLDEVFEAGNLGKVHKSPTAEFLRSVSVGDVISTATDSGSQYWVVAPFGFQPFNP